MRYFKHDNKIMAFDESQEHLITDDMIELTAAELNAVLNPPVQVNHKLVGVEFNGVMCSATKEDMWGLNAIKEWVVAGNDVNFEFDNGNVLTLTKDNYSAFEAVWVPFRAGFF